jgi:hypothetical protein
LHRKLPNCARILVYVTFLNVRPGHVNSQSCAEVVILLRRGETMIKGDFTEMAKESSKHVIWIGVDVRSGGPTC